MRTLQRIITEITRDAPSARVTGGQQTYAHVEIPGTGGAHAIIYLAPAGGRTASRRTILRTTTPTTRAHGSPSSAAASGRTR